MKAEDEALWALPDVTTAKSKLLDFLQANKVWIIVGSIGLFALALFGRRRR